MLCHHKKKRTNLKRTNRYEDDGVGRERTEKVTAVGRRDEDDGGGERERFTMISTAVGRER